MFYKSREFCKVADCINQKFLDDPECPESTKVFLKEKSCPECFAHKFHAYLQKEGYSIVKLPFPSEQEGQYQTGGIKMIELKDIQEVIAELTRKKENTEKFVERQKDTMSSSTKSMLLSDADLFKRYAEIASDLSEEDLKDQSRIEEFLFFKDRAVSGTLYELKVKPIEEALI